MESKLKKYNSKRNFDKTGEPRGEKSAGEKKTAPLAYAVQHHLARRDHYDLRLEWKGVLLSWAIPKGPSFNPADKRLAVMVEDHPLDYKDFEGTIPQGEYGGGTVMLWDRGSWEPLYDADKGLSEGSLKFILYGKRLKGRWTLVRLKKDKEEENQKNWLFIKEKDDYAQVQEGVSHFVKSVKTARAMEEIAKGEKLKKKQERNDKAYKENKNPFQTAQPMLAKLVDKPPEGEEWLFELKYDGYRALSFIEMGRAKLLTRNNLDYTAKFSEVANSLKEFLSARCAVLDGEIVVTTSEGKTDFQALQNYIKKPQDKRLSYVIFDILALDGEDLRKKPLEQRKAILEKLLQGAPQNLTYSKHIAGGGDKCFSSACKLNLEGIVGKLASSSYAGGRNGSWVKIKCDNRQEFAIGGYTLTDKKSEGVSALLLGVYKEDEFIYTGRAGTGFSCEVSLELESKFKKLIRKSPPFKNPPAVRRQEKIIWLTPALVAEVKFAEKTKEGLLRQASFKGLRIDKSAREVKWESAQ